MRKIVLFGGAFDPVHNGHIAIYHAVKKDIKPNQFIVIPSKTPPLKDHKAYASSNDRLNMLKLAFGSYKDVQISTSELDKKGVQPSYSVDTVKYFSRKFPDASLFFVIGHDRYLDFQDWKSWKEILKLVKLIVINRGTKKINGINNDSIIQVSMAPVNISSTQLRQNPVQKYIPSSVLKYIVKNNLYIEQQVQSLMSLKRYQHSVRVAQLAVALAKSNDIKLAQRAYVAALYHDVAKEFDNQAILKLVGKYDHLRFPTIHTLHGVASAKYIEANFHIKDSLILNAIANHVIPPKNPSILDKILYCADKLEPSRTKSDVTNRERYVRLAKHDINKAFSKLHQEMINRYI